MSRRSACRRDARWTLAERMAAERDAFGFYFSAHPVDAQRHLLAAHKVRSFAEVAALPAPADGGRSTSMLAGLVEGARWRMSAKGRRYLMATISDASGQYEATAFDDEPSADLESAAKSGACGLMTVELDRRPGDDMPRVTVKRFQPLDSLAKKTRLRLRLRIADPAVAAGGFARTGRAREAATAPSASSCRSAKGARRRWFSAAISISMPTSPPASPGSWAKARSSSARRSPRGWRLVGLDRTPSKLELRRRN